MNVWRKQYPNAPLREPAGDWFVNRKADLDYLWEWASSIPTKGSHSINGLRRTGKSSMMIKLYNRLFFEQEKVMPIYITFARYLHRQEPMTSEEFVDVFFEGAVRSYLAFRYKRPDLQLDKEIELDELLLIAQEGADETVPKWFERYYRPPHPQSRVPSHRRVQWVINFLDSHAHTKERPMLIMIDEFQVLTEVKMLDDGRVTNITGSFQQASESWDAPLLVSGSSVSMLRGQALGGLLSGRFSPIPVRALEPQFAIEMVFLLGQSRGMPITNELAEVIVETTNGYPYPIECIMFSKSPALKNFPDVNAVGQVVEFELTNHAGVLREHYDEEYGKYVTELNGDNITRKILYWITNQKTLEFDITAHSVANAMSLDVIEVQTALDKLHRMDIIQRRIAMVYSGPRDPLMKLYLNSFHHLTMDDLAVSLLNHDDAVKKLRRVIREMQGEINRKTGHFTEIIVAGLLKAFDDRLVDGKTYFGVTHDVKLHRFAHVIRGEGVVKKGIPHEIDVIGAHDLYKYDAEGNDNYLAWMVSVRYREKRMSVKDVRAFIRDVKEVQREKGYSEVIRWYFSKSGFTANAEKLLRSEGIYFSDLAQFNLLADMFYLMRLET
ncbi:MAG: hypothetical protein AAF639_12700 [Chloroflexota bacterium]